MPSSRLFRRLKAAAIAVAVAATTLPILLSATPASACIVDADGDCYLHVNGNAWPSNGLNARTEPWGQIIDTLPSGYNGNTDCYVYDPYSGTYWDWIWDSHIGRSVWVADQYLYTGGNINQQVDELSEGRCGYLNGYPQNWIASSNSNGTSPSDVINLIMQAGSTRSITALLNGLDALPAASTGKWQDSSGCGNSVWANINGNWVAQTYSQRQASGACLRIPDFTNHFRVWHGTDQYGNGLWYFSASTEQNCFPSGHCTNSYNAGRNELINDISTVAHNSGWQFRNTSVQTYDGGSISNAIGNAPYDGYIDFFKLT